MDLSRIPSPAAAGRINAIMTASEAKEFPTVSRMLALETGVDVGTALHILRAATKDLETSPTAAFARLMRHHAGPYLGAGECDERSNKGALAAARAYLDNRSR